MVAVTKADVLLIAPELSVVTSDSIWTVYLAMAATKIDSSVWGGLTSFATCLLVAHAMSLRSDVSPGKAVASQTVGGISRTYQLTPSFGHLDATTYGQQFEQLLSELAPARVPMVL